MAAKTKLKPKLAAPAAPKPKAKKPVSTTKPKPPPVAKATPKAQPKPVIAKPKQAPVAKTGPVTPPTPPADAPVPLSIEEARDARRAAEMAMYAAQAAVSNTLDDYHRRLDLQGRDTNWLTEATATLVEYQATKRSRMKYRKQIPTLLATEAELAEAIEVRGGHLETLRSNLEVLRPRQKKAEQAFRDTQDVEMVAEGLDPVIERAKPRRRGPRGRDL